MINRALHADSSGLWRSTHSRLPGVRVTPGVVHKLTRRAGLAAVALSIGILYWPVMRWTIDKFLLSIFHWHWFVAAISIACALRASTYRFQPGVNNNAALLLLLCTLLEVANQLSLQIHLASAVLLIVSVHAFSGHLIPDTHWRAMKWPMVVGIALLPLDFYLEPYFGYPLRLVTATVAGLLMQGFGYEALSSQSILLVENRASVVDLGCSGINSLWAGGVFYLLLSWMTRLSVGLRWWLLGLLLVVLLLSANIFRIVVLLFLDLHDLTGLSEIAHTSLGAVGFTVALLIVWQLAQGLTEGFAQGSEICQIPDGYRSRQAKLSLRWPLLPLTAMLIIAAAIPDSEKTRATLTFDGISLPDDLQAQQIELNSAEQRFFDSNKAIAVKYQLGAAAANNSVVFVTSNWWKAQHKPDHCLQTMGFSIQNSHVVTLEPAAANSSINAVTVLNLIDEDQQMYTAVYWFQAADSLTADHYRRMTDTFRHPNRSWTMVSVLLSGEHKLDQIHERVKPIQQTITSAYKENQ